MSTDNTADNEGKRQLVEVIAALRSDIEAAIEEGEGKHVKFDVGEVEVELKASISRVDETDVGGKLSFKIWGIGGETGGSKKERKAKDHAHVIKLKLRPLIKDEKTDQYKDVRLAAID